MAEDSQNIQQRQNIAGNSASLRSRPFDQTKQVPLIKDFSMMGNVMVTTWLSITESVLFLSGSMLWLWSRIDNAIANQYIAQSYFSFILMAVGFIIISVLILFINPSQGSELKVIIRFLFNKLKFSTSDKNIFYIDNYSFENGNSKNATIVRDTSNRKNVQYIRGYRVYGAINKISFPETLDYLNEQTAQVLRGMGRNVIWSTVNSVKHADIEQPELPSNATEAMQVKNSLNYTISSELEDNQQLDTIMYLTSTDLVSLETSRRALENVLQHRSIAINYYPLTGKELKKRIRELHV